MEQQTGSGSYAMVEHPWSKIDTILFCLSDPFYTTGKCEEKGEEKLTRGKLNFLVKISDVKRGVQRYFVGMHMLFVWDGRHTKVSANL